MDIMDHTQMKQITEEYIIQETQEWIHTSTQAINRLEVLIIFLELQNNVQAV